MHDSLLYLSGGSAELKDNDSFWGESQPSSNPSERWHTRFPLRFAFHLQARHLGSVALWKYKHGGQGRGHSIAPHKAFSPLPPEVSYKSFSLKKLMESNLSHAAMLGAFPSCAGRTLNVALLFQVDAFQSATKWHRTARGGGSRVCRGFGRKRWSLIFCNMSLAPIFNLNVQVHTRLDFLKLWCMDV